MNREHRYWVAKTKDVEKYLSEEHQLQLDRLLTKIRIGRLNDGKADVQTVCVDSDWPEYETVWKMIEARVDCKASPASAPEGWKLVPVEPTPEMAGILQWFDRGSPAQISVGWGKVLAAAPTPPVSEDRKDAERFRFLLEDHADRETRLRIRELFSRLPVMSHSAARAAIDAAMEGR